MDSDSGLELEITCPNNLVLHRDISAFILLLPDGTGQADQSSFHGF